MPSKGRLPGPTEMGEAVAAADAGQNRRRGSERRSSGRRETEAAAAAAVEAGAAGGELGLGVAIEKVGLESAELRGYLCERSQGLEATDGAATRLQAQVCVIA